MTKTTFYTATLGCKINQYETQALREVWLTRGFTEVDTPEDATLILVNSCAVTANAVADVRSTVRQSHRKNPKAQIIITGCAAQVLQEELAKLPGVTKVVPQEAKTALKQWPEISHDEPEEGPDTLFPDFSVSNYTRARAVVKVQDGCSHRCTYCIVPFTRGRSRSRSVESILQEAQTLMEHGFRELILSGVNLRQFGRDIPGTPDFWDLVTSLQNELAPQWEGKARFRISSLEPGQLGAKALDTLAQATLIAPQLHLSLQSGSDSVLKRMGRGHYTASPLHAFLQELSDIWPTYGLGADILMGFPGETEQEFAETLAYVKALPLTYAHVFPYSQRPGTAAATMKDQLAKESKKFRAKAVRDVVAEKKTNFLSMLVEKKHPLDVVLQSGKSKKGISQYYTECRFTALPPTARAKDIIRVTPVAIEKGTLLVRI